MSYNVSTGAIVEFIIKTEVSGQTCLNILHYRLTTESPRNGASLLAAFLEVQADIEDEALPLQKLALASGQDTLFRELSAQWIAPLRYRKVTTLLTNTGDINTPSAPSLQAITFTKFTDIATRRGIGSFHMVGAPQSYFGPTGLVNGTALTTTLEDVKDALLATVTAGTPAATFTPVIYNRETPADSLEVQGIQIQPTARAMQRRVVGRGI